jgi:hypothetical protein
MQHISILFTPDILSFSLSLPAHSPQIVLHTHSRPIITIIIIITTTTTTTTTLGLGSTWVSTYNMWPFELGLSRLTWWLCVCVCVCLYTHIFFIHSSVVGNLSWFHSLAIVNRATINTNIQASLLYILIYISSDICPRVVWQGYKVGLFLVFLRNLHTDFHSNYTSLHSYQQCIRALFPHILTIYCCFLSCWWPIWWGREGGKTES